MVAVPSSWPRAGGLTSLLLLLHRLMLLEAPASFCGVFGAGESASRKLEGRESFLALCCCCCATLMLLPLPLLPDLDGVSPEPANELSASVDRDGGRFAAAAEFSPVLATLSLRPRAVAATPPVDANIIENGFSIATEPVYCSTASCSAAPTRRAHRAPLDRAGSLDRLCALRLGL